MTMSPIFRISYTPQVSPCGGNSEREVHLLTSPGQLEPIYWETKHSDPQGNCTLRLVSDNNFHTYVTLFPIQYNKTWFSCGREDGIERNLIQIPSRFICRDCTLQLIWETTKGTLYKCADLNIATGGDFCKDRCQNKGICVQDYCQCKNGYTGEFCEIRIEEEKGIFYYIKIFLLISLLIFVFVAVVYLYHHEEKLPKNVKDFLGKHAKWALKSSSGSSV